MKPVHVPWGQFDVVLEDEDVVVVVGRIPRLKCAWPGGMEWSDLVTEDYAICGPFFEKSKDCGGCRIGIEGDEESW